MVKRKQTALGKVYIEVDFYVIFIIFQYQVSARIFYVQAKDFDNNFNFSWDRNPSFYC